MAFLLPPPLDVTELASFIPRIPALLHSEVDAQLRDDQRAPNQGSFSLEDSNQLRVIKSTCDAFNATISDLEDAGKKLDALKNYVTLAKRFAIQKLAQHQSLTSPTRKLPNEVLQLIFIEVHAQSTQSERRNPITAQVCTFWREVAEATPILWTDVSIYLGGNECDAPRLNLVIHVVVLRQSGSKRCNSDGFIDNFGDAFSLLDGPL